MECGKAAGSVPSAGTDPAVWIAGLLADRDLRGLEAAGVADDEVRRGGGVYGERGTCGQIADHGAQRGGERCRVAVEGEHGDGFGVDVDDADAEEVDDV